MNIAANLDWATFHNADHCAVTEGDKSVCFSGFRKDANRMASSLVSIGIIARRSFDDQSPACRKHVVMAMAISEKNLAMTSQARQNALQQMMDHKGLDSTTRPPIPACMR